MRRGEGAPRVSRLTVRSPLRYRLAMVALVVFAGVAVATETVAGGAAAFGFGYTAGALAILGKLRHRADELEERTDALWAAMTDRWPTD